MSHDAVYLRHILEAIEALERYVAVGYDEFMQLSHWQDAVIRRLEIIGEAVKQIPWRSIAGTRDVLIHDYMGVDLEAVWEVTQGDISELKLAVERLLAQE